MAGFLWKQGNPFFLPGVDQLPPHQDEDLLALSSEAPVDIFFVVEVHRSEKINQF